MCLKVSEFTAEELEQIRNNPEIRSLFVNEQDDPYGYPDPPNRDSLLKLFRDILSLKTEHDQISKIGFLKDGEIGYLGLPVRNYLALGYFCDSEGWDDVATYLRGKSNIMVTTSLSRKAKFLELAVTQKRVSQNIVPRTTEVKKGLFGSTEVVSGGNEE